MASYPHDGKSLTMLEGKLKESDISDLYGW